MIKINDRYISIDDDDERSLEEYETLKALLFDHFQVSKIELNQYE